MNQGPEVVDMIFIANNQASEVLKLCRPGVRVSSDANSGSVAGSSANPRESSSIDLHESFQIRQIVLLCRVVNPAHATIQPTRSNMLRILSEKKRNHFYHSMKGKNLEILFEGENMSGFIKGFSANYVRVSNIFNKSLINKFADVKITNTTNDICTGTIVNKDVELVA